MEKMKRFRRRLSLTLRPSASVDESLSELAEQLTIEDSVSKDSGQLPRAHAHTHARTHTITSACTHSRKRTYTYACIDLFI